MAQMVNDTYDWNIPHYTISYSLAFIWQLWSVSLVGVTYCECIREEESNTSCMEQMT